VKVNVLVTMKIVNVVADVVLIANADVKMEKNALVMENAIVDVDATAMMRRKINNDFI